VPAERFAIVNGLLDMAMLLPPLIVYELEELIDPVPVTLICAVPLFNPLHNVCVEELTTAANGFVGFR
jgi:hypothetical protein